MAVLLLGQEEACSAFSDCSLTFPFWESISVVAASAVVKNEANNPCNTAGVVFL